MHYNVAIIVSVDDEKETEEDIKSTVDRMLSERYDQLGFMMDYYSVKSAEKVKKEDARGKLKEFYDDEFSEFKENLSKIREHINESDYQLFNDEDFRHAAYRINPYVGWHLTVFDDTMTHIGPSKLDDHLKYVSPEIWLVTVDFHY